MALTSEDLTFSEILAQTGKLPTELPTNVAVHAGESVWLGVHALGVIDPLFHLEAGPSGLTLTQVDNTLFFYPTLRIDSLDTHGGSGRDDKPGHRTGEFSDFIVAEPDQQFYDHCGTTPEVEKNFKRWTVDHDDVVFCSGYWVFRPDNNQPS